MMHAFTITTADALAAALVPEGYSCFFRAKTPSPATKFGFPADGIALFYRHARFSCAHEPAGVSQLLCHLLPSRVWQKALDGAAENSTSSSSTGTLISMTELNSHCSTALCHVQDTALNRWTGSLLHRAL